MLTLDVRNVSVETVGAEHGLDLPVVYREYGAQIGKIVTCLYETKDEAGGWKRWLDLGNWESLYAEIEQYAASVKGQFEDMVVLGIGGSSLGGYALLKALLHPYWNNLSREARGGYPRFHFIENVDADQVTGLFDILQPKTTLFLVISKSGTTAETMSAFMVAKDWLEKALGNEASQHVVAVTDKQTGLLRPVAEREGYATFEVPDDVGGRFSVFSAVGLLPAALCGVDIRALQRGLKAMETQSRNADIAQNPAAQGALIQYLLYGREKNISVFMPYSWRLSSLSDWYVQLWAESLGKANDLDGRVVHVGPTPVRAVGVTDQHSQVQLFNEGPNDKVFTFIEVQSPDRELTIPAQLAEVEGLQYLNNQPMSHLMQAEFVATRASLTRHQRPNMTVTIPRVDAEHFAQLIYLFEVQTALAGALLNIDPFDQPGVELAKKYTYALMGRKGYEDLVAEARGERLTGKV